MKNAWCSLRKDGRSQGFAASNKAQDCVHVRSQVIWHKHRAR